MRWHQPFMMSETPPKGFTQPIAPAARLPAFAAGWGPALLLLVAALAVVISVFSGTAWSIVSIWDRSETFAHGFLIVPISLWLVWEKRDGLTVLAPSPKLPPLLLFAPLGFAWLLANLVDVLVVEQYAFVGMLAVTIWAVLGHRVACYLAFPILFLFLGVPVGEGLIYPMMNFTADFTVRMLELTGIPVYREGTFFTIPTGQWSVVEACSGVRYLIASVTLGVLFAYLTYTRWWKRVLFVVFATLVPILANGLRAYLIVMLAHVSDMKLATGIDHIIYGWVFFGIVVSIMFLVGSLWRDPAAPAPTPDATDTPPIQRREAFRLLGVVAAAAVFFAGAGWALSDHGDKVDQVAVIAPSAPGWALLAGTSYWDWRPEIVGADGSIFAFYRSAAAPDGSPVGLYLGVYRTQRQGAELVSSGNMMIRQKHPIWSDTMITPETVQVGPRRLHLQQHQLASRRGERLLVWTWYLVGDRHTSNPYLAKLLEAKSRLFGRRGEAALIAVAAPYSEHKEAAAKTLSAFVESMLPAIDAEVVKALRSGS